MLKNYSVKIENIFSWEVYAGSHDISESSEPHRVVVKTTDSYLHPDWNPSTLANDIALIKLPTKIEFDEGIPYKLFYRPISTPMKHVGSPILYEPLLLRVISPVEV